MYNALSRKGPFHFFIPPERLNHVSVRSYDRLMCACLSVITADVSWLAKKCRHGTCASFLSMIALSLSFFYSSNPVDTSIVYIFFLVFNEFTLFLFLLLLLLIGVQENMVNLTVQRRLAASVLKCGKRRIWMDPNEVNAVAGANSR